MPIEVPSHSVIAVGPGAEKKVKRVTVGKRWKVSKDPQGMHKPFRSSAIGHGSVTIGQHGRAWKEQTYNGEFMAQSRSNDTKISQTLTTL